MPLVEIEISLSFYVITWLLCFLRGAVPPFVLTENMFSSSCTTQPVSTAPGFFFSLAAQVHEHVFVFNRLDVFCVALLA